MQVVAGVGLIVEEEDVVEDVAEAKSSAVADATSGSRCTANLQVALTASLNTHWRR